MAKLNKGEKLNGDNFEIWSIKIQYILEEQEVLKTLNNVMAKPEYDNTTQHRRDPEGYNAWKRKNSLVRITLLSSMENGVMHEYRKYDRVMELWVTLKERFCGTSLVKLKKLTISFDTYNKRPKYNMRQHLNEMSNMISKLKKVGHKLTNEQ